MRGAVLAAVVIGAATGSGAAQPVTPDQPGVPTLEIGPLGFEVGGYVGYMALPTSATSGSDLGNAVDPAARLTSGPTFGARLAIWPTERVGLEAELGVIRTGFAAVPGHATVLATRAHLAVRIVRDGRFGMRAALGAGAMSLTSRTGDARRDTDSELHWGLGFTIGLPYRLEARVDARHLIGPARDAGYASMFELALGFGTRWGP
jgi:hypothetical protein